MGTDTGGVKGERNVLGQRMFYSSALKKAKDIKMSQKLF